MPSRQVCPMLIYVMQIEATGWSAVEMKIPFRIINQLYAKLLCLSILSYIILYFLLSFYNEFIAVL